MLCTSIVFFGSYLVGVVSFSSSSPSSIVNGMAEEDSRASSAAEIASCNFTIFFSSKLKFSMTDSAFFMLSSTDDSNDSCIFDKNNSRISIFVISSSVTSLKLVAAVSLFSNAN
jgi:hypothetical protein